MHAAQFILTMLILSAGCTASPQPILIHRAPNLTVALMDDPRAASGHSHPAALSTEQMAAALRGIQLRGRDIIGGLGLFEDPQGTPAFSDRELALLAPYLSAGLAKASPRDIVTFHYVQRDSNRAPLVTSGGVFVRGPHLYAILANAKTSPSSLQYETTYEPDSRVNPLLPIARYKFTLDYQPTHARVPTAQAKRSDGWDGYLDESKVVVVNYRGLNDQPDLQKH